MNTREEAEKFIQLAKEVPILDVRSPGEYQKGHIPGAISFPLFNNQERAEIGTIYKQVGQAVAVERGMELVQPKIQEIFNTGNAYAKNGKLLVHCWRGGKRSEAVAGLLGSSGTDVRILNGGYKAYRNWVLAQFEKPYQLSIVGGGTGSGKTKILHALEKANEQILDLEGLADHRGSAFGRLGAKEDVTFTQFENRIADKLFFNKSSHFWVEDESRTLGKLYIPAQFWEQMRAAKVFHIELPDAARMEILLEDYGHFPASELEDSIRKLGRRLGGLRMQQAVDALSKGDLKQVIRILLPYYDKAYSHSIHPRSPENIQQIPFDSFDADAIARELIALR